MITNINLSKKNERYAPHILNLINRYNIPHISRIIFQETPKENEESGEIIIIIFTKDYLSSSFSKEMEFILEKEIVAFFNLNISLVYISQDPNETI